MPRYSFFKRGDGSGVVGRRFVDADEASRFLRSTFSDRDTLNDLRRWAHDRGAANWQDRTLLQYASGRLVSGELRVTGEARRLSGGGSQSADPATASEARDQPARNSTGPGARVTPSMMRTPQSEPEPQAPQAPPAPKADIAKQIATLLAAAQNGTPFCEQCEKAKSEAAG